MHVYAAIPTLEMAFETAPMNLALKTAHKMSLVLAIHSVKVSIMSS